MNEEVGPNLFLSGAATGVNTFIVSSRLVNRKLPVFTPTLLIFGSKSTFWGSQSNPFWDYRILLIREPGASHTRRFPKLVPICPFRLTFGGRNEADRCRSPPSDHRSHCGLEGRSPLPDHTSRSPRRSGQANNAPIQGTTKSTAFHISSNSSWLLHRPLLHHQSPLASSTCLHLHGGPAARTS